MRHYSALIGGKHVDTAEHAYALDIAALLNPSPELSSLVMSNDPALDSHPLVLGSVAMATPELQDQALEAAAAAWPEWMRFPVAQRLQLVRHARRLLRQRRDDLTDLMMAEGCPRVLADWQLDSVNHAMSEETLTLHASQLSQEFVHDGVRLLLRRLPDGVVCFNPPRNAPASNSFMCVPALAGGNSVVVRVPRSCPMSLTFALTEIVAPALDACGAPPGTLNIFCADQPPTMRKWLSSPLVNDIFFFGNSQNGMSVERRCVEAGKKAILELSGNDGLLVWHDADLSLAAAALGECFLGSGQICMAPKYAIVHPLIADELLARVAAIAAAQRSGDPRTPGVTLSPVLQRARFFHTMRTALDDGAALVCGGQPIDANFVEPTVVRFDGFTSSSVIRTEKFFPLLPIVVPPAGPSLLDPAIDFMNANPYGLRNSLWSTDPAVIDRFLARMLNGGNLRVNLSHLSCHPYLPTHGGTGLSGGPCGEANFSLLRTTHLQAAAIA